MDEFDRAVSDHFVGPITQDGHRARRDLNETSLGIRDQDEVLRRLEDAARLFELLTERPLGPLALGDVARGFGCTDYLSRRRPDRLDAHLNIYPTAVLSQ